MLRRRKGSIFLKQQVAIVTNFYFLIYQKISHEIKMKFGFIIFVLDIHLLIYFKTWFPWLFKNVDVNS